jgi:uncharacterized protein
MSDRGASAKKVDLRLLRAERGAVLQVECDDPVQSRVAEIPFTEPVAGRLTLTNLGAVLRIEGRLRTVVDLTCDLCTMPFKLGLEARVEEEIGWMPGDPTAVREAGEAHLIHAGDAVFLDVDAVARDALVLALPMVARCSPDCRGLCSGCGANLRLERCRCGRDGAVTAADPRLESLAGWRKDRSSLGPVS